MTLKIGTRGSKLALWQAAFTQKELARIGVESELVVIKTKGDQVQHLGFDKMEGKGFFTKEIEDALLRGEVDLAVHSMKDLPTTQPDGLVITAVSYRDNPADWLLVRPEAVDTGKTFHLKEGALVGTSAARRKAQLLDFRPDAQVKDIRGNVPTRLEKLRGGDFDAIFLAAAGLNRLGLDTEDLVKIELNPREFVPAPAQGVLAWQTNRHDQRTRLLLKKIHHPEVSACTNVERRVLQLMGGGCQLPLGVYCERDAAGNYHAFAASTTGGAMRRTHISSSTNFGLADRLAAELKD
ncbi:MAG: hydroxymethylbilane synthase [Saprospiraceae bacterium]|nr:hydroxymethylbilane synthase [Saprospiraceae bacterium]MCB0573327.1 hydroxymethylbilane synthase [Saprospiraceae bacterium]MCB9352978.1 hydroxymethylbilane synthase [Lewinellaceae bacterium]